MVLILGPGEGERIGDITFKGSGREGLGHFSLGVSEIPPGAAGPPLHIHDTHDEAFYIVSGELTMRAGDDTVVATTGTYVFVPAGEVHGFANRSPQAVLLLGIHAPGDYQELFRSIGALGWPRAGWDERAARGIPARFHDRLAGPPLGMGDPPRAED